MRILFILFLVAHYATGTLWCVHHIREEPGSFTSLYRKWDEYTVFKSQEEAVDWINRGNSYSVGETWIESPFPLQMGEFRAFYRMEEVPIKHKKVGIKKVEVMKPHIEEHDDMQWVVEN